jgi:putative addiction module component (TIGR02574 family)
MAILQCDEIARLSPPEPLALIAELWDSLEPQQVPSRQARAGELDRRLGSIKQDRPQGMTWQDVKAELEQRCP